MNQSNRRKVLFVTEFLPWPLNSGGRIRSYHILRQVALKNDVTLIAEDHDGMKDHFCGMVAKLLIAPSKKRNNLIKALGVLTSLIQKKPYVYVYSSFNKEMAAIIEREVTAEGYDIVHFDHLDATIYIDECGENKLYLDEHNYETQLLRSLKESQKSLFFRFYLDNQIKKIERFEGEVLKKVDAVGVVSEKDGEMIRQYVSPDKINLVPNGVDTDFFRIKKDSEPFHIVSVGSLDWRPNVEGLIWFLQEVWPLIVSKLPEAQLTIVGRNPDRKLYRFADDSVSIAASVPDVREYVKRASLFIVPLFAGGGTRLKVLEAMAMGISIVATSRGAEGIDYTDGVNVCIADDAKTFYEKVIYLLEEKAVAEAIASSARELVTTTYSWDAIGRKLEYVYDKINS